MHERRAGNVELIRRPADQHLSEGFERTLGINGQIPKAAPVIRSDQRVLRRVSGRIGAVSYMSLRAALDERLDYPWVIQNSLRITGSPPRHSPWTPGSGYPGSIPTTRSVCGPSSPGFPLTGMHGRIPVPQADQTYRWFLDTAVFTRESGAGARRLAGLWMDVSKARPLRPSWKSVASNWSGAGKHCAR